jgi:hypothetical protein
MWPAPARGGPEALPSVVVHGGVEATHIDRNILPVFFGYSVAGWWPFFVIRLWMSLFSLFLIPIIMVMIEFSEVMKKR